MKYVHSNVRESQTLQMLLAKYNTHSVKESIGSACMWNLKAQLY